MFSERSLGGAGPSRRVVRLGARVDLADIETIPARHRPSMGGPRGVLVSARLRARTSEVWCRLRPARPFARTLRTIPLGAAQPPTPTPDALDLRRGARVDCDGGVVGRLESLVIDARTGLVTELVVRVRGDVAADVARPSDPLAPLVAVAGQRMLVPPTWATRAETAKAALPFMPAAHRLLLQASAAQIAHGVALRGDTALEADVWRILALNPAVEPGLGRLRVVVREGVVTLLGALPTSRHRLSAEQDVWHVPGVLGVHNEITAEG
ncbi:MAG TPA: BON domain-containing protein [Ktedonobacterales bacterium]|jgi:hypothetical protein